MDFNSFFKKHGAILVAILLFVIVAAIYCSPVFSGKTLDADDTVNYIGASKESSNFVAQSDGKGSWWTSSMFSGMPNYQIGGGAHYLSETLLAPVNRVLHLCIHSSVWALIFYFVCFYILLLAFGISPWLSIFGALTMGLSTYFITLLPAGHATKTACLALTTVVFAGYKFIFNGKYILGSVLVMLFVASGYTLHPQMFYYFFMMMGLLWIAELCKTIKDKNWKKLAVATGIFIVSVGIGVGTGSANAFANSEYAKESTRGGSVLSAYDASHPGTAATSVAEPAKGLDLSYMTGFSYGIDETLTLMIPGFKGGSSCGREGKNSKVYKAFIKNKQTPASAKKSCNRLPLYWGNQPLTYGSVYVGAIICFLFLLGLFIVKSPYKWLLLASTLASIMLAWGSNFMWLTKLFYNYFPLYGKFRAVSSILIVAEICMPILAFMALKTILDGSVDKKKLIKSIYISAGVTAGICLFFAIFGTSIYDFKNPGDAKRLASYPQWVSDAIIDQRKALLTGDSLRSALLIIGSAFALLLTAKTKVKKTWMVGLVGAVSVVELLAVDLRYFNHSYYQNPSESAQTFELEPYEKDIIQDLDPDFRVMNTTVASFNESRTSYYMKSVGGYSAAKLSRYNDLIDEHLTKMHMPVYNMLNTKYFILKTEDGTIYPALNRFACGHAWFVNSIDEVDNPRSEMDDLMKVDLYQTAVVNKEFSGEYSGKTYGISDDARIDLIKFAPNHLLYRTHNLKDALVVFSEIWYPYGWKCTLDGQPASYFRANYVLRSMTLPAGDHEIVFDFDPDSVKKGNIVSAIFIFLMYGFIIAAIGYGIFKLVKKNKK